MSGERWAITVTSLRRPWWGLGLLTVEVEHTFTSPPGTSHTEALMWRDRFLSCSSVLYASVRPVS